ncbi:M48 family metallopeptidase [Halomonas cupida]|uniref:metalloprotease LoiP n=1 Tax=Halomonas TaxID=2745 RepID=UPI001A8E8E59|nr:M48 family metallopeptidase [Halomonas litopenaei]MBN8414014.1 M48 family metallopeptidase [Halomonas litopenaei]
MNLRHTLSVTVATLGCSLLLSGCENMSTDDMISTGLAGFDAATISDEEIQAMSAQACEQMDAESAIATPGSEYAQRLQRIADNLGHQIDGIPVSYKVYMTDDINAWAMANGCVRVYSGLMDMMTDNEIEGVLGHELGHVALGHSKKAMQTAYATSIARDAMAASGNGAVAALSSSQLGDLSEKFINAQFSQSQESDADNFSFDLLTDRGIPREGLLTGFEKFADMDGGESRLMSSHPGSKDRADNIRERLANG